MPSRDLPARPSLEQLKNQAKDLLKAYRARDSFAYARFRESFLRLSGLSDDDLVRRRLTLRDAQHLVAAEYGFPSWPHMQTHIERREDTPMLEITVDRVNVSTANHQRVVVLKAKEVNRYLPIWIGPAEADSIAMKLKAIERPPPANDARPDGFGDQRSSGGGDVGRGERPEERHLLRQGHLTAQRNGDRARLEAERRYIALAVRTGAPIYADETVVEKAGIEFDPETGKSIATNVGSSSGSLTKLDNRFSEKAKSVLAQAEAEAKRFQHNEIESPDILLGLINETEGVAAKPLVNLDLSLEDTKTKIEAQMERGESTSDETLGFSERSQRVLRLARAEGHMLFHHYIGTEHLLLGLIVADEESTANVLKYSGVEIEAARIDVMKLLGWVEVSEG